MRKRNRKKQFWLSFEEERQLRLNAIKVGLSESEYVRSLIMGYHPKEKPSKDFFDLMMELRKIGININQIAKHANQTGEVYYDDFKIYYNQIDRLIEEIRNKYL